jgi:hypothetical protein
MTKREKKARAVRRKWRAAVQWVKAAKRGDKARAEREAARHVHIALALELGRATA